MIVTTEMERRSIPMNETEARWHIYAAGYDNSGPVIVPDYHEMHELVVKLCANQLQRPGGRVLDLGAGAGRLLERLLDMYPACEAVWFDNAEMMQHRAQLRLNRFGDRVSYVLGNFREEGWQARLDGSFTAVVSSHAIHHASDSEKQRLFRDIYALLHNGGIFVNADEVLAPTREEQERRLHAWNRHVLARIAADEVDEVMIKLWESWQSRILNDPWGQQTEFWNRPDQLLQWLQEAGFSNTRCWWERGMWAVYSAER
jgi:tRNA (cmo5U34)-methyltransferase